MKFLLLVVTILLFFSSSVFAKLHYRNADYDGDGKIDQATWNSTNGMWRITDAKTGKIKTVQHGQRGDWPVPADYDGDGAAEVAIWRPSSGKWYISTQNKSWSVRGKTYWIIQHGRRGDMPFPANYDSDIEIEIAIFRPSTGLCYISTENQSWSKKRNFYEITRQYRCGQP